MNRRRILIGLGVVVLLGLALRTLSPSEIISPRAYYGIRLGMNEDEVEAVIGLAPGTYFTVRNGFGGRLSGPFAGAPQRESGVRWKDLPDRPDGVTKDGQYVTVKSWWGNSYLIQVAFDERGEVAGVYLSEVVSDAPSFLDRVRRLFW